MQLTVVSRGIEKQLQRYLDREAALQSYLNKNVVEQYRNIQRRRWMTENVSEDPKGWPSLNTQYAERKRKLFASYPGRGTKMMIRTGDLFESVIGPGKGFRKITTPRSLIISTTNPYAADANAMRDFTSYSAKTRADLYLGIAAFIFRGIQKRAGEVI
jgi:hypothetical protein